MNEKLKNKFYGNIGKKIKLLAQITAAVLAIALVITGIALMSIDEDLAGIGFITMLLGPAVAWISSLVLYGFGELIEKVSSIESKTGN